MFSQPILTPSLYPKKINSQEIAPNYSKNSFNILQKEGTASTTLGSYENTPSHMEIPILPLYSKSTQVSSVPLPISAPPTNNVGVHKLSNPTLNDPSIPNGPLSKTEVDTLTSTHAINQILPFALSLHVDSKTKKKTTLAELPSSNPLGTIKYPNNTIPTPRKTHILY